MTDRRDFGDTLTRFLGLVYNPFMTPPAHVDFLLPYVARQWRWLIAIVLLTLLLSLTAALQPLPIKLLVDYGLRESPLPQSLRTFLIAAGLPESSTTLILMSAALSLALFVVNSALAVGLSIAWSMAGQRMVYDLAGDVFARLQRLSLRFHRRRGVGDTLSRLMEDSWCIYSLADGLLIAPIQQVVTLGMLVWIGFWLDPLLATLAVAVAPLLAASSWFFGPRLKRRSHRLREARSRLVRLVHNSLGALPLVQAFGTADRHNSEFRNLNAEVVALEQRGSMLGSSYGLINGIITSAGLALVLYVGGCACCQVRYCSEQCLFSLPM